MTKAQTKALVRPRPIVSPQTLLIALTALCGVAIITIAGHVQATALHDAAHDVRHATGFPCH